MMMMMIVAAATVVVAYIHCILRNAQRFSASSTRWWAEWSGFISFTPSNYLIIGPSLIFNFLHTLHLSRDQIHLKVSNNDEREHLENATVFSQKHLHLSPVQFYDRCQRWWTFCWFFYLIYFNCVQNGEIKTQIVGAVSWSKHSYFSSRNKIFYAH